MTWITPLEASMSVMMTLGIVDVDVAHIDLDGHIFAEHGCRRWSRKLTSAAMTLPETTW